MIYFKTVCIAIITSFTFGIVGCNNFLEVKPNDRIMDEALFSDTEGFLTALNGVYSELNSSTLYGRNLSMGMIDVMAQYYSVSIQDHVFLPYVSYNYSTASYKAQLNAIWAKSYELVANCNIIIQHCDNDKGVLPEFYKGLIKGEALALRAMLHFDLLRMFGVGWSEMDDTPSIPYMTQANRQVQPLRTNKQAIDAVITDLLAAKALLETTDPIINEGPRNYAGADGNNLHYRQYRLNYYAVKALLARAYLWHEDRANAFLYAKQVTDECQIEGAEWFPFVTYDAFNNRTGYPDRIFSTEVLFAGYNRSRINAYNALFSPSLSPLQRLTFAGTLSQGRVNYLYDDLNDYRYRMWATTIADNQEVLYLEKFADVSDNAGVSDAYRYMMPRIRVSEMYLIQAECTDDLALGTSMINKIRLHRGAVDIHPDSFEALQNAVMSEYVKEFIGEGQLFFYLKRRRMQNIPDGKLTNGGTMQMDLNNYIFPLPENEISQRN